MLLFLFINVKIEENTSISEAKICISPLRKGIFGGLIYLKSDIYAN